jgi:protein-L-isoaspartate(D-aspartate) O-methyltransferase
MAHAATAGAANASAASEIGETTALRRVMVERQLRPYDVNDVEVLSRFLDVPREEFLPPSLAPIAYSDLAITVGRGADSRTFLPPLILARFLQVAEIRPHHKVLDIAGGAGYSAALLSGLAREVVALECDAALSEQAKSNLAKIEAANVRVLTGPLDDGAPDLAPFDVILIHGAVESGLGRLLQQLSPNGRLLAFTRLEPRGGLKVVRFERSEGKAAGERAMFDAAAPLLPAFANASGFTF